ncbi:MAG TPA: hypothetical protein VKA34_02265 [Balneolales bacterium]|nr:hypothetical protein [Balneolales bacterium]
MKRIGLLLIVSVLFILDINNGYGQILNNIQGGAGLFYGTNVNKLGVQINGYYTIPSIKKLDVGIDFLYFFPQVDRYNFEGSRYKSSANLNSLNINAHYNLYIYNQIDFFGLAGLNFGFSHAKLESQFGKLTETRSRAGFNIGGGLKYHLLFAEIKYIISDFNEFELGGGVRIPISRL